VNLSGAHVCRPEVVPRVLGALADAGVAPRHLIVELTERELLADVEVAASNLRALRDAGVRIAIDDFGTGFTSLAHLRWLPIDKLKIDKSFVTNLSSSSNESLVRLVIETGHVLGVEVTAEGVETVEELEALRTLGADHVQGYLTGRPEAAAPRPVLPSP
jgi:EAL domain-containing protein (putative c-di-GMP-specific phosphodiesterase class I)